MLLYPFEHLSLVLNLGLSFSKPHVSLVHLLVCAHPEGKAPAVVHDRVLWFVEFSSALEFVFEDAQVGTANHLGLYVLLGDLGFDRDSFGLRCLFLRECN